MTNHEKTIVKDILLTYFLKFIDADAVVFNLLNGGYIDDEAYKYVIAAPREGQMDPGSTRDVVIRLTDTVGFVAFLWSLCTSGYNKLANCLLQTLNYDDTTFPKTVTKLEPSMPTSIKNLVSYLKFISDTRMAGDPSELLRKFSMRTREKLMCEQKIVQRVRLADKYFAILSVELDNFTYLENNYLTFEALCTEIERIVPQTGNPALHEALYNSRRAEVFYIKGNVEITRSLMEDSLSTMVNTVVCAETANILYQQLNVLLREYERFPSVENKQNYLDLGEKGIRLLSSLEDDFRNYFLVTFMQRLVLCALDIGITGQPIASGCEKSHLEQSRRFLDDIKQELPKYGLRRNMLYSLSTARLQQLSGDKRGAMKNVEEAERMAKEGKYAEYANIKTYRDLLFT